MKFEENMKKLEEIVGQLEKGEIALEQAVEHYYISHKNWIIEFTKVT